VVLNETQNAIRDSIRDFAQIEIRPNSAAYEQAAGYPPELFVRLAEMGLFGLTAPEAFGGAEADYVSYALALIELGAADGALSTIVSIQNSLLISGIIKYGSPVQQQRFLPALVSGEMIGAFALTETDAGSDAAAITTRARKVEGGWKLNGAKQFITSGKIAGVAMVYAVTDPAAGKKGISGFLVPTDRAGYLVDKVEHKMGQAASDTCAIRFDDLFIEDELLFGPEGQGYKLALSNLEAGRIGIAAQCVGMAQAALEIAVGYARERKSMGKTIIEHQAVGFRLADLAAKLEAARHLVLHAAALKDAELPCLKEAETICSGAIQTLGGYGYLEEYGLAKIYRDVRVCQIYEGTSDIQRMVIARAL